MSKQYSFTLDEEVTLMAMNERYLSRKGRLGGNWKHAQKGFGARYSLILLDGQYIDAKTKTKKEFPHQKENIPERVLLATMDLFGAGHEFLYHTDKLIRDSTRKAIGRKLIEIIQNTEFTEEENISRALYVLIPGGFGGVVWRKMESVKGTWLDPDCKEAPYDKEVTKKIIAELVPLIAGRFAE